MVFAPSQPGKSQRKTLTSGDPVFGEQITINALGFRYEVLTERHILRRPVADNVAELLRFRRAEPISEALKNSIKAILRQRSIPALEIQSLLPGVDLPGVYRGLVDGWISTSLDVPLSDQSLLRLPNAPERHQ